MARGDWVVLVAFAAMALAPLIGLLVRVWTKGGVITGADGFLVLDPMQYVNWLRQSGDLAPQPIFTTSRLGLTVLFTQGC
jgi:hypothetical protein